MTASLFIHTVPIVCGPFFLSTGVISFGRPAPFVRTLGAIPHVRAAAHGAC